MKKTVTLYTDGACSGNPGVGGYAGILIYNAVEKEYCGGEELTTNNRMELMAAIKALETIYKREVWQGRSITIFIDSQYVKNGITTWINSWKKNGWKTASKSPVKNKELWLELDNYSLMLNPRWVWVKGHAGNKYNEICDELARTAQPN